MLLAICAGNSSVPGEFPTQRPVARNFDVRLICVGINGWINNREAGDLRRHRAHCDVIEMLQENIDIIFSEKGSSRGRTSERNWLHGQPNDYTEDRWCLDASEKYAIIGSENGPPLVRCHAITRTNADSLSITPLRTLFNELLIKIRQLSFQKIDLKMSSAKSPPLCPGDNGL